MEKAIKAKAYLTLSEEAQRASEDQIVNKKLKGINDALKNITIEQIRAAKAQAEKKVSV